MKALNFIYNYLRNHKQRTKIDNEYSSWQNMNHEDIVNYADDNTPYVSEKILPKLFDF